MAISTLVKKFIPHAVIVATAALAAIAAVAPAQALTFYSDRAAFNAGSKNLQNIDFEDFHTDDNNYWGYTHYGNSTITEKGVQFTDSYKYGFGGSSYYGNYYGLGSGDVLYSGGYSSSSSRSYGGDSYSNSYSSLLNILLPSDTTAIAFDFKNFSGGSVFKMSIDDQVFDFNPSINFVGFTSDTAISSIKFLGTPAYEYSYNNDGLNDTNGDGVIDSNDTDSYSYSYSYPSVSLDNFTFGEAATSVPEPASVLGLLAVGALGATSQIKRKQQGKA